MNKSKKNIRKHKRTKRLRNKLKRTKLKGTQKTIGGVKIYQMDGEFTTDPTILHKGNDFFKKTTHNEIEKYICELLMNNPHKNIITIYGVGKDYIDMELLNTDMSKENINKIKNVMTEVKNYLQGLGIMYIDWKLDNIGISKDGEIKLFDFDVSGLVDVTTGEFILNPPKHWAYNNAINNGWRNPIDIDNFAFENGIK